MFDGAAFHAKRRVPVRDPVIHTTSRYLWHFIVNGRVKPGHDDFPFPIRSSPRGACGRANRHAGWRLETGCSVLAAQTDRRPKPRSPGAPAARHEVRVLFRQTRPKARRKSRTPERWGCAHRGIAEQAVAPQARGMPVRRRTRGDDNIRVLPLSRTRSRSAPGAQASRAALAMRAAIEQGSNKLRGNSATIIPPAQKLFARRFVRVCKWAWRRNTPVMLPQSTIPCSGEGSAWQFAKKFSANGNETQPSRFEANPSE